MIQIVRKAPLAGPLAAVAVVLAVTTDNFLTRGNIENVLGAAAIIAVPGVAMTFCLAMGEFDLSIGSTVSLAGIACCGALINGLPLVVGLGAALGVGAVVGLANGLVITKLGVTPFIATLATLVIVRGIALAYTGGHDQIVSSAGLKYLVAGRPLGIPMPIVLAVLGTALAWWTMHRTRFGRWVCAIGSNRDAATMSGLPVDRIRIAVYVLVGLSGGLWGLLLTSQLQKGNGQLGLGFELDAITIVVLGGTALLGGRGSIIGTVLGAVLIETIRNGLNLLNVPPAYQRISVGLLLIAALALLGLRRVRPA